MSQAAYHRLSGISHMCQTVATSLGGSFHSLFPPNFWLVKYRYLPSWDGNPALFAGLSLFKVRSSLQDSRFARRKQTKHLMLLSNACHFFCLWSSMPSGAGSVLGLRETPQLLPLTGGASSHLHTAQANPRYAGFTDMRTRVIR